MLVDIDTILNPFQHFGVNLGLERIEKLLASLGNPHHSVPIIHVAGTNGKGSVCAYLSSVLTESGYRVGRYNSPHLIDWNERICINEKPISTNDLAQLLMQVVETANNRLAREYTPTQFEVITAAAWLYFAQQQVDVAVVEVGLGGRLDATNVCDRPLITIITSISREHWQILGPTLADIAGEKAGILKLGCPAVIGQLPEEAMAVVKQRIAQLNCPALFPKPARHIAEGWAEYEAIEDVDFNPKYNIQYPKSVKYPLPLLGEIQLSNSALAIASLQILQQQGWNISAEAIASGMAKTKWPGRLQWTTWKNRRLLIDGAHNPEAAIALRQFVDTLYPPKSPNSQAQPANVGELDSKTWVMGMLSTKDHADIFQALLRPGDRLYLVPVPDNTSADPEYLATLAKNICPNLASCQLYPDLIDGLEAANLNTNPENLIVLCGSLYLLGYFLQQQQL